MTTRSKSKTLILTTSILAGLQTLVAAGSLADMVGPKVAALLVVIVAAAHVTVNSYISQSVNDMANTTTTTTTHIEATTAPLVPEVK